jgi:DNA polymerase-3 subunit beta
MDLEISRDKLAKGLSVVSRVAANLKTALPVLNNVLIRAEGKRVVLTATNLEIAAVYHLRAEVKKEGTITAPAKLLAEFVQTLPRGANVVMRADGDKLITGADNYRSTLNGIAADDFPELPQIDEEKAVIFRVSVEDFRASVSEVVVASSTDTTRPALTGVYFSTSDGALFMAATDGYRLAEKKFVDGVSSEVKAIVPTSSLSEVLRSISDDMEEIEVLFDETQVRFRMGDVEVTSRLLDGSFPDYRQLIPKKTDIVAHLATEELLRTTKLAALFVKDVGGSIVIEASKDDGVIAIKSVASELGENTSEIKTDVSGDGKVTLNSKFLVEALNVMVGERLVFGFSGRLGAVVVRNEGRGDYTHLVMPLKS